MEFESHNKFSRKEKIEQWVHLNSMSYQEAECFKAGL